MALAAEYRIFQRSDARPLNAFTLSSVVRVLGLILRGIMEDYWK